MRKKCSRARFLLASAALVMASLAASDRVTAQTSASDGVIDVSQLPGLTLGNRLSNCIQEFKNDIGAEFFHFAGGTCDARRERGGTIGFKLVIEVPNLTILLGSGVHTLTGLGGFRLLAPGITISGQGSGTYFETSGRTASAPVFDIQGGVAYRDLDGDLTNDPVPVFGVILSAFEVEGVRTDTISSSLPQLVRFREISQSRLENVVLRTNDSAAVVVRDSEHVQVVGNTVSDIYTNGILVAGTSRHVDIVQNTVVRTGFAALLQSSFGSITVIADSTTGTAPSWIRMSGNTVRDYGGAGLRVTRIGAAIPEHIQIMNNRVESSSNALVSAAGSGTLRDGECIGVTGNHIQIIGNRVDRAYVNGIAVFSDAPEVIVEDIIIANNIISNSSQMPGAFNIHHGIALILPDGLARDLVISGNIAFDDQVPPTQKYTVSLNPGSRAPSAAVENLYVEGNIGNGNIATEALHPNVVCAAAQSGNLPAAPACS